MLETHSEKQNRKHKPITTVPPVNPVMRRGPTHLPDLRQCHHELLHAAALDWGGEGVSPLGYPRGGLIYIII